MLRPRSIALLVLAACSPSASPGREPGMAGEPAAHEPGAAPRAAALLATLAVQPRAAKLGYARDQYGPAWADTDRNGCDTRNDILRRDLAGASFKPGTRDCVLLSGTLADPYTRAQIRFERGGASEVDVDHVVALGNAWVTGAAQWPFKQRVALANDPLNLLAVEAAANRAKGDGDAATWLPPNHAFRCAYVARQIAVKAKYGLWVTPPEREAMARVLRACPDEPAPVGEAPILAPLNLREPEARPEPVAASPRSPGPAPEVASRPRPGPTPEAASRPRPSPTPEAASPTPQTRAPDPNYGTCKQAKAHRAGPYVRGRDPEYAYYQDRDGDGVVCE